MVSENTTSGEEAASYYTESNYHQPPQARGHFASSVAFSLGASITTLRGRRTTGLVALIEE